MKVINNVCEQHRGTKHQQVKQNNKHKYTYPHTLTQQLSINDRKTKSRQKVRHRNKKNSNENESNLVTQKIQRDFKVFARYLIRESERVV